MCVCVDSSSSGSEGGDGHTHTHPRSTFTLLHPGDSSGEPWFRDPAVDSENSVHPQASTSAAVQKRRKRSCSSGPGNHHATTARTTRQTRHAPPAEPPQSCGEARNGTRARGRGRTYHLSFSSEWLKGATEKHVRQDSPHYISISVRTFPS